MESGELSNINFARVGNDKFCAALSHRLPQHCAKDGVLLGGVRTDDKESLRLVGDIIHTVGHRTRTEGGSQTGYRAGVSETGAVVYIIRPHDLPRQFVHQIVFFVQALRRSEEAHRIRAEFFAGIC